MRAKPVKRGGTELVDPLDPLDHLLNEVEYNAFIERPNNAFLGKDIIDRIKKKHEVSNREAESLRAEMVMDGLLKKELHKTYIVDGKRVKGTWFRVVKKGMK